MRGSHSASIDSFAAWDAPLVDDAMLAPIAAADDLRVRRSAVRNDLQGVRTDAVLLDPGGDFTL